LSSSCARYPDIHKQVKFILPENISKNLDPSLNLDSNFILRADIKGDDAASAADRIAQAVPGALLNTGAIKGKPSYFHVKSSNPYLPESWFAQNISGFFKAKKTPVHTQEELGLKDTAPNLLAALMTRKTPK
jgi:hypothetical protein